MHICGLHIDVNQVKWNEITRLLLLLIRHAFQIFDNQFIDEASDMPCLQNYMDM